MYTIYYDSGTTNTRAYLLRDGVIAGRLAAAVGAKNSALEGDNTCLVRELFAMYGRLTAGAGITGEEVEHIYLSGMISSPSGIVEIEHLAVPVDAKTLRENIVSYEEARFFRRSLEIIPGIKTLERGKGVEEAQAASVNMMRGEEIEVFGILRANPELKKGICVFVLPGSHTQAVLVRDGRIEDISSNITGELFRAITKESILGASVAGDEPWEMDGEMVCLGGRNVHRYGFNRAIYILRILDLFTEAGVNRRRSYFEGALNVGVMDAAVRMLEAAGMCLTPGSIRLAVAGDGIQKKIYEAFCGDGYPQVEMVPVREEPGRPFSVGGLLEICGIQDGNA